MELKVVMSSEADMITDMNPFNGIERSIIAFTSSRNRLMTGIHSMELKVAIPPQYVGVAYDLKNPFNGIERFMVIGEALNVTGV